MAPPIRVCTVAGLAVTALALPAAAQAATKDVSMGVPGTANQRQFVRVAADVNDYFPHRVTIRRGDSVRFTPASGFHTVDIPPRGGEGLPLFVPQGQATNVLDEAGSPFWFNGQPNLGLNPALLQPQFGRTFSYDGSARVESGLPLIPRPRPMTVRFRRTGRVTYVCDVHPGMQGIVNVVARRSQVPSRRADRRAVRRQIRTRLATARQLVRTEVPANTVSVGVSGRGLVHRFAFQPSTMTINAGTTIRFVMARGRDEVHTATTGPGNPLAEEPSYLKTIAASFETPTIDPRGLYPSEPPGTVASLTPTLHGNGFWNSGVLDRIQATPPPAQNAVQFSTPGTYTYYCLIHPFMKATINVR